jgi:hypothetical protein
MVSARMRTQAYTAVVCMAVRSLTVLPLAVPPKKKLYVLPYKVFLGLALDRVNLDINGILISFLLKMGIKKAPDYVQMLHIQIGS